MKTYLVVGGTQGIGKSVAVALAAQNHQVFATGRNVDPTQSEGISYFNWDAHQTIDLPTDLEAIDGLVYAPGTINLKPFHRISREEFLNELQINTLGAVEVLQKALPLLKKSPAPSVVMFSTVAVAQGMPFHSSISIAKGAVEGLVKSLAAEWAPSIRINAVAPSLTATALADKLLSTPEKIEASNKRHPLQRIGTAEDIANAALYLLSEQSSWVTGQVLRVDGGMSNVRSL